MRKYGIFLLRALDYNTKISLQEMITKTLTAIVRIDRTYRQSIKTYRTCSNVLKKSEIWKYLKNILKLFIFAEVFDEAFKTKTHAN